MDLVRFCFAITNLCNRSCELCSTHSDQKKQTNMPLDKFVEILSVDKDYEVQLDGGEPTLHPNFWEMIDYVSHDSHCQKIILCTNGVNIPIKKRAM